jgi:ppGpp synthetase/RelA/SpoT-type nucleotidyltranferase
MLDSDRELIDEFRESHLSVLETVQGNLSAVLHQEIGLDEERFPITSRLKTPQAIVAKLKRSSTALSRMQDIAGARIVLPVPEPPATPLIAQAATLPLIVDALPLGAEVVDIKDDQTEEPDQWGYRAIHVIGRIGTWYYGEPGSPGWPAWHYFEVQLRTAAQDRWAQVVERVDAAFGWDLKHGVGPADWLEWLHMLSDEFLKADRGEPFVIPPMPIDAERDEPQP